MHASTHRPVRFVGFLAVLVFMLAAGRSVQAAERSILQAPQPPSAQSAQITDETPNLWFVELRSAPAADGTSLATLRQEKAALGAAAAQARIRYSERFAFDTLWNGLSVRVNRADLAALARVPGVKAIYPVELATVPPTTRIDPELATALAMTGADIAQSELGYTGMGVRVAVMDTGIDYDHPDLGGSFGGGCRVAFGWDFVGDAFNADPASPAYNPMPVPDPDPDDCNGHGTHVAGIVGAHGNPATGGARGVAPEVTFGAYRVFGCDGSTTTDIMIAAMERALADRMHVLNMSIGSAYEWPQNPTAQASDRLVNKGVVVVASIGNNGAFGVYSAGAPGLGSKVIGVAAFDNTHSHLPVFTISPDNTQITYIPASGAPPAPLSGSAPMARTGTATSTADGCMPLPAGSLTGKVALIRRGTCAFHTKSLNAQNAGAAGVVIYNNVAGPLSATVAGSPPITIPVVTITAADGVLIDGRLAVGPVTLTWTNQTVSLPNATGGLISSFSSYGLAPDLTLKPDIGAPGGFIRSTLPIERGSYGTVSGTSMSSPHVAGAAALLLQARPHTPAQAVRGILQNSADPRPLRSNPMLGLEVVHRQGAGMLDIDDAILATTTIEPGKLSLGEGSGGTHTLSVVNKSAAAVTYNLSHAAAVATTGITFVPSFVAAAASVSMPASITVPAGGTANLTVTIGAPGALADRGQYGGYIVLTPMGGGQINRVPYAGFKGDYQSIQALTPTPSGFPWLAKLTGCTLRRDLDCVAEPTYANQPSGATYTLQSPSPPALPDVPYILLHLDHQVRRLRLEVKEAGSGKSWHRALDLEYVRRNQAPGGITGFFSLPWDGVTQNGQQLNDVPNGRYVIVLSVLKALGDENNPAHWQTWTSPVITIARP